jgi:hypothetical protein
MLRAGQNVQEEVEQADDIDINMDPAAQPTCSAPLSCRMLTGFGGATASWPSPTTTTGFSSTCTTVGAATLPSLPRGDETHSTR